MLISMNDCVYAILSFKTRSSAAVVRMNKTIHSIGTDLITEKLFSDIFWQKMLKHILDRISRIHRIC
ncbi:hypothetical protein JW960_27965, partial [candidate division KSB1 bacterium]|nr:hypothetical protein [candidate division KSB1 bacterium]